MIDYVWYEAWMNRLVMGSWTGASLTRGCSLFAFESYEWPDFVSAVDADAKRDSLMRGEAGMVICSTLWMLAAANRLSRLHARRLCCCFVL